MISILRKALVRFLLQEGIFIYKADKSTAKMVARLFPSWMSLNQSCKEDPKTGFAAET
jgi:hypothetical protein